MVKNNSAFYSNIHEATFLSQVLYPTVHDAHALAGVVPELD